MRNVDWFGVFLSAAIAFVVLMPAALVYDIVSTNRAAARYIPLHKCVVIGFAGEQPEPYYQCDTGLKRRRDMR